MLSKANLPRIDFQKIFIIKVNKFIEKICDEKLLSNIDRFTVGKFAVKIVIDIN